MLRRALRQNTGKQVRAIMPSFRPCRISSSVSSPCSKYFSISASSFSAAFSTSSLCRASARSFSLSGIGSFSGLPPSSLNTYMRIFSRSMMRWKPSPCSTGYCITVTAPPKWSFACATVLSKSACGWSSWFTPMITGRS